ncbi:hypothetical protein [Chryseobacterium sp. C3]|uniref:hypothetical protein n=1 Tax=Chryseobacterium sp. C3 TaxID=2761532 RepID=UPI001624EE54|nr:hypothetical protein [Chryseobacterium sp. C3]
MKVAIKFILIFVIFFSFFACNKVSKKDVVGVYKGDKVPTEFSDNDYRYLVLKEDNIFYLKYTDIKKPGIVGSWKILDRDKDALSIQFSFPNQHIIGKLDGNTFLFEKPNIFDPRFPSWLYVKTDLETSRIIDKK